MFQLNYIQVAFLELIAPDDVPVQLLAGSQILAALSRVIIIIIIIIQ